MNKRMLVVGFILLAIAIAVVLEANQIGYSVLMSHSSSHATNDFLVAAIFIFYLLGFVGAILVIYGFISKDPPVHWNNNL